MEDQSQVYKHSSAGHEILGANTNSECVHYRDMLFMPKLEHNWNVSGRIGDNMTVDTKLVILNVPHLLES